MQAMLRAPPKKEAAGETATLGGGCFWCLDAVFRELRGVQDVRSGYSAGFLPNPTYEDVCSGTTGHAEVVQVRFDPKLLPYRRLLEVFFSIHDPTTPDRQGADEGPQYRSIILHHTLEQRQAALDLIQELEAEGTFDAPIVTQVEPLTAFYPAEAHHQDYYRRNTAQPYCRAVITPKVAKFRAKWHDLRKAT